MKKLLLNLLLFNLSIAQAQKLKDTYVVAEGMKIEFEYNIENPGVPDGLYSLYLNEKVLLEGTFTKGVKNGIWKVYYESGSTSIQGVYINGQKSGEWKYYREDGSLKSEVAFIMGKRTGVWKSFHTNGKPWSTVVYESPSNPKEVAVYSSEEVLLMHQYWDRTDSAVTSKQEIYYKNGNLFQSTELTNGLKDGEQVTRYPNKMVQERLLYSNGKLLEVLEMRTEKGQPRNGGTLHNGNGVFLSYYENGLLRSRAKYNSGSPYDSTIYFYRNGFKQRVEIYSSAPVWRGNHLISSVDFNKGGKPRKWMNIDPENGEKVVVEGKNRTYGERKEIYTKLVDGCEVSRLKSYDPMNDLIAEYPLYYGRTRAVGLKSKRVASFHPLCSSVDSMYHIKTTRGLPNNWLSNMPQELGFFPVAGYTLSAQFKPAWLVQEYADEVYSPTIQSTKLNYPGGMRGFIDLNLGYFYQSPQENAKSSMFFLVRIDEMGNITEVTIPLKDNLGAAEAIKSMLQTKPIFEPTFINGFPTNGFVLYEEWL